MKKCLNCGTESESKFCPNCGKQMEEDVRKCQSCGAKVEGNFCPNCGSRVEIKDDVASEIDKEDVDGNSEIQSTVENYNYSTEMNNEVGNIPLEATDKKR